MATDKDFRVKNGLVVAENISAEGNISITGTSKIFVDNSQIWDDGANFKLQGNTKTQYQVLGQYGSHIFYSQDGSSSAPNNHTEVFNIAWTGDVSLGNNRDRTVSNKATAHDVAGKDLTISAGDTTAGTTDNIAGGDLILQGGQGKGTGAGGSITFQVADGGSTGSTLNSLSTAMTIADDGKVGIGVTPTTTLLEIGDGTDKVSIDPTFVRVFNDDGSGSTNATVQMWAETWGGKVGTTSSDDFLLYAHNAERVKFDGAYRSIFYGSTSTKPTVRLTTKDTTVSDTDTLGIIEWTGDYDSDGGDTDSVAASISAVAEADFTATANTTALVFNTATSEAASEKMRITNDGKVGIGTNNPDGPLHIYHTDNTGVPALKLETDASDSPSDCILRIQESHGSDTYIDFTVNTFGQLEITGGASTRRQILTADDPDTDASGIISLNKDHYEWDTQIFGDSSTPVIYVDGTNNRMGVGTTSPGFTLEVSGDFAATTKSFDIEHPTKEGMRLHHGSLEGPEHGVYVRGRLEGVFSVIDLPDYWTGLVDEDSITVQLTPNGGFQQLYVEGITENKVYVKSQSDEPIDCFYFIQAERKDVDKMEVEY